MLATMKRVISLLLVICGVAGPGPAVAQSARDVFAKASRSIVVVLHEEGQGSGVVVGRDEVVTNCHVVGKRNRDLAVLKTRKDAERGNYSEARVIARDDARDLCLLRVPDLSRLSDISVAVLGSVDALDIGAEVFAIGAPEGLELSLTRGLVSQIRRSEDGTVWIQTDAVIAPGSSGGGLFDNRAELVGITTSGMVSEDMVLGINFAVAVGHLTELRKRGRAGGRAAARDARRRWGDAAEPPRSDEREAAEPSQDDGHEVDIPASYGVEQISAGNTHSCVLLQRPGPVRCWGADRHDQSSPPDDIFQSVSAGGAHSCGLLSSGMASCWGHGGDGRSDPPAGRFIQVSAGYRHSCGVLESGGAACWGYSGDGRSDPPAGRFIQVSAGHSHSCGVSGSGRVLCWGDDESGQSSPPPGAFLSVSAGGSHSCGLRRNGRAACWGSDNFGQVSSSDADGRFVWVGASGNYSCGLQSGGAALCWGSNRFAQKPFGDNIFLAFGMGALHSCGLLNTMRVLCWGYNGNGQADPSG